MRKRVPFTPGNLSDHLKGTHDVLVPNLVPVDPHGGVPADPSVLIGDAGGSMFDFSRGGNDSFAGAAFRSNFIFGDSVGGIFDFARGGNDSFTAAIVFAQNTFFGDTGGNLSDHAKGGNDAFTAGSISGNTFFGDAGGSMSGHSKGGNDTFTGKDTLNAGGMMNSQNTFYGDAGTDMSGHAVGGNDHFTVVAIGGVSNTFYGDAGGNMSGYAHGGNDSFKASGPFTISTLTPDTVFVNTFYGDAHGAMSGFSHGGNDRAVLSEIIGETGTHGVNTAVGDALSMSGHAVGGKDTLTGGNASGSGVVDNILKGDADGMSDFAKGGNDVLVGGNNTGGSGQLNNFLYGDAVSLSGRSEGGNDKLYAGTAAAGSTVINDIWGDGQVSGRAQGGQDIFVFKDHGSMTVGTHNTIEDFSQRQHDRIEFSDVAGADSFKDLVITHAGTDTIITAGADQVTLNHFTGHLTAHDFLFT